MTLTQPPPAAHWWPETKDVFEAALAYHQAGLCVIPLRGKRPALTEWKRYQSERPTPDHIRHWQQQGWLHNLGIVCGAVSGNLVVIDFDGPGAYGAYAAMFPQLAQSYTVKTGSGKGQHVYFKVDSLPATTRAMDTPIGHIELRSDGTYVAAPPSTHPITKQAYLVEQPGEILRVPDLDKVVDWIESFKLDSKPSTWQPPRQLPPTNGSAAVNPDLIQAIANRLREDRHKGRGEWINCACVYPEKHKNSDRNHSFGFNLQSGYGFCYRCGSILAKDIAARLGIDPQVYGGLTKPPAVTNRPSLRVVSSSTPPPSPPEEKPPSVRDLELPAWLQAYVSWASQVGNQTPELFHLGMGIWMASVAIARRVYTDTRWGVRIFPNLYLMFIADTTFYRKTTAYKLGERILTTAIPHLLMPTPGSPERFQDALAGKAPSNFSELPQEHQKLVLEAMKFSAQRGLFKDEIAGLFGSFKRDYMSGLKDFILEIYDCPDFIAKETQSGLAIIRNAAPSILGVTTPAGLSSAISLADWDNGLLPRFGLLTPEPDYRERPGLDNPTGPPMEIIKGLRSLYDALPKPEQEGDGWKAARALRMEVGSWDAIQIYSDRLRKQCDPRHETPLDDRLKGVYGRLHVQALKVAEICAALDWAADTSQPLRLSERHWQMGQAVAEHWRLSAHRLVEDLTVSPLARQGRQLEDRLLGLLRGAGVDGLKLRDMYRTLRLDAATARQTALELVRAGILVETRIGAAEAYALAGKST